FQAEDGIRDRNVTGVQTCALPILSGDFFPSASEYTRGWGLTNDRYKTIAGTQTLIMHPGPMNRGLEISAAAADSVQSTALEQVANGVSVRMAVLYLLLASQPGQ